MMTKDDFIGVWKLLKYGDGTILTSETHLVVQESFLWKVYPDTVYYENQPGPEVGYQFEAGQPARMSQANGFKYLVKREGDILFVKLGPIFGRFPKSFNDEGTVGKYTLETSKLAESLRKLPTKTPVETLKIKGFGALTYDSNLEWWSCKTKFQGKKIKLHISADPAHKFEPLDKLKVRIKALKPLDYAQIAAEHLLTLFNESWNNADTNLSFEAFQAKVALVSISLELDGKAIIWLTDGELFQGHSIILTLDANQMVTDAGIVG